MKKTKGWEITKNILLILLGSLLVGLANALFLVPFQIVKGGMTSVAMILSKLIYPASGRDLTDIFLWAFNVILWFIAFFFVGKKYALMSLVGTVAYPLFLTLFSRFHLVETFGITAYYEAEDKTAKLILFGLAGGVINGIGLSFCFMGKGSTGGSDVLSALMVKYLSLKQENASLWIDTVIILLGFAVYQDWGSLLVGILTAVASSLALRLVYGKQNTVYVLDILTDHVDEVKKIISEEFHDTCTIYSVEGGYSGETKKIVHAILVYKEAKTLKAMMPSIDPHAFVSVYESTAAWGGSTQDSYIKKREKERILEQIHPKKKKEKPQA